MSDTMQKPLLVSGPTARRLIGVGNTKFWSLVKAGAIETVEVGGRKMVKYASLERLAQGGENAAKAA
ncbi:MAG TPA: hypothetical protein VMB73_25480 [Acetobacteraceae bacterium]|nr:hypothetical protein [Acetobacteraceae bacterium]